MRDMLRYHFLVLKKDVKAEMVGVEVGVQYGLNAFEILINCPAVTLHLVDSYDSRTRPDCNIAKEASEYILAPFGERKKFHYMTSEEASKKFDDQSLDFVYIDAAHDFKNVCNDIRCWFPKIKMGGLIGGHDFFVGPAGEYHAKQGNRVANAVVRSFRRKKITYSQLGDWWIVKDENTMLEPVEEQLGAVLDKVS